MVKDEVLRALEASRGGQVSGEALAERLGVSRAAVWKAVRALRADGLAIDAATGGGYALRAGDDSLTAEAVLAGLRTRALGRELTILQETDSTSTRIKRDHAAAPHGFALLAETQTGGRGRLGRAFSSPPGGGLYLSVLLRPRLPLAQLNFITLAAAVAVCRAIEDTAGFSPRIKWVNDVLMEGKKLCGILTEAAIEGESGAVDFAVLGIGINLRLDRAALPEEVRAVAGALADFSSAVPRRAVLAAAVLNRLEETYTLVEQGRAAELLADYRARLCMLGRTVRVVAPDGGYEAEAVDINGQGHLLVRTEDGAVRTLSSGEISIRL